MTPAPANTLSPVSRHSNRVGSIAGLLLMACGALAQVTACGAEPAVVIPAPAIDSPKAAGAMQTAVLAGGCFWGVQGVFQHLRGVRQALSGYAGGQ